MNQDFLFFYMTNLQVIMYSQINKVDAENDPQHRSAHAHTHTLDNEITCLLEKL